MVQFKNACCFILLSPLGTTAPRTIDLSDEPKACTPMVTLRFGLSGIITCSILQLPFAKQYCGISVVVFGNVKVLSLSMKFSLTRVASCSTLASFMSRVASCGKLFSCSSIPVMRFKSSSFSLTFSGVTIFIFVALRYGCRKDEALYEAYPIFVNSLLMSPEASNVSTTVPSASVVTFNFASAMLMVSRQIVMSNNLLIILLLLKLILLKPSRNRYSASARQKCC